MLDSVTLSTVRPLLPVVSEAISKGNLDSIPGWRFWWKQNSSPSSAGWKLEGQHDSTGLYVTGVPYELRSWSGSLPGLLHGFNGRQLKSDAEITASFDKVHAILGEITTGPRLMETFRRLDVCMNLAHPEPQRLVAALRDARHPWIRRETEKYANGSVRYPGTDVVFTAYWKEPPKRSGFKRKAWNTPEGRPCSTGTAAASAHPGTPR